MGGALFGALLRAERAERRPSAFARAEERELPLADAA
jgi:hypothetical protein